MDFMRKCMSPVLAHRQGRQYAMIEVDGQVEGPLCMCSPPRQCAPCHALLSPMESDAAFSADLRCCLLA
jgi:hypothetical protein